MKAASSFPGPEALTADDIVAAAALADTNPSEDAKKAGNYRKGHITLHGLPITIENAKGSMRRGISPTGEPWSVRMPHHYGYVKRTLGADGDAVDCYIGDHPSSTRVWVLDQKDADTGKFDEHKAFLGFPDLLKVLNGYGRAFSDGRAHQRLGGITEMSVDQFKEWLASGATAAPYAMPKSDMDLNTLEDLPLGGPKSVQAPFDSRSVPGPSIPNTGVEKPSQQQMEAQIRRLKADGMFGTPFHWSKTMDAYFAYTALGWSLDKADRKSPPKGYPQERSQYAVPDKWMFPIDRKHIHAAISYFPSHHWKDADKGAAGRRIMAAARRFGVHVSPDSDVGTAARG